MKIGKHDIDGKACIMGVLNVTLTLSLMVVPTHQLRKRLSKQIK